MATGFLPNQWGVPNITGPNGIELSEIWKDEPNRNYQSISVPGLPNFFVLIGTNSPITNVSLIDIAHSEKFVLVDKSGYVRSYYETDKHSINQMMIDVGLLANSLEKFLQLL